ncbi:DUF5819 family protein [Kitasatospora sp. NPDC085879]|uniref:DUF5819 family protein n=1 Tax=Kitasatospora sp. NPDC085879 TaxID=3154769 RepID=UPI00343C7C2E
MNDTDHSGTPFGCPVISPATEATPTSTGPAGTSHPDPALSLPAAITVAVATVACVMATLAHVCLVFLHVAPSNAVSQQYQRQIDTWIYPYFEQNWQLFAPNPESVRWQISARASTSAPDGSRQVGAWQDLTAIDEAAVRHSAFPSHTAQNMLRRAWAAYLETHGPTDRPATERARMLQEYLANIAARRLAGNTPPALDAVQLRVTGTPVAPPGRSTPRTAPSGSTPSNARYLPWWQVESHDR